jgi:hypothetical protein
MSIDFNNIAPFDVRTCGVYHLQGTYFIPSSKGGWYPTNEKGAKVYLIKNHGISTHRVKGEPLTQIEDVMASVRDLNSVSWAGSVGGMPPQLTYSNGRPILIMDGPKLIEPVKGDFPIIDILLRDRLGGEQLEYYNGWKQCRLKNLWEVYHGGESRPGQFLAMVGPSGAGKNLVQERIITPIFGGRVAKPTHFFNDRTNFNGDLVGAEHWQLSDETPARDFDSRRAFGNHIKVVASNAEVRTEIKYGNPIVTKPFHLGTVSLNDEEENIRTLPPLDPSIEPKLMALKFDFAELPLPAGRPIEEAIAKELSAYVHYLLHEHKIRAELRDARYGIKAYQHPDVLQALADTAPETQLLLEIDRANLPYKKYDEGWEWRGSSGELQEILEAAAEDRGFAARTRLASLLRYGNTCGTYLARLAHQYPDRISRRRGDMGYVYHIKSPLDWDPELVTSTFSFPRRVAA